MKRTRIVFLGAGSVVFARNVLADILWHESLADAEIRLVDIDPGRLRTAEAMTRQIAAALGRGARIQATRDRRRALPGADVVICAIGVGGFAATRVDLELPAKRFGLRQTIGDTLGAGGVFRAVRSIPEVLRICADMERDCPRALLINYANPMAMHCLAIARATDRPHVGICHGVQNTAQHMRMIIAMLGEKRAAIERHFRRPWNDPVRAREWQAWSRRGLDPHLRYTCAGINHMAFFLEFASRGRDLYPQLRQGLALAHIRRLDPVRFALFERLGYFMTETSGHTAEYVPWFLKSEREIREHHIFVSQYLDTCRQQDRMYRDLQRALAAGRPVIDVPYTPSNEHCSRIIHALVTGEPFTFNGNVMNVRGRLISNLPADCCVEVPCRATRRGIRPLAVGALPPQCAAMVGPNVSVQDLAVRGILEGRRDHIRQAILFDPNTASQLSLGEIDRLVEALFRAHAKRLPRNLR